MERPVMTSASSHRLRSAVSACAQPTHSYLSSSHFSASVQVESHNSGGCFKKFNNSGKNGDASPLNIARKAHSSRDFSPSGRRHRLADKHGSGRRKSKKNGKEIESSSGNGVLNLISKQLMLGNDFLSKLKLSGKLIESKRLAEYLEKSPRNEAAFDDGEKLINGRSGRGNDKKNGSGGSSNGTALSHRRIQCGKGKSRNSAAPGAKDGVNGESESGDECPKCGIAHSDEGIRSERQDISKWQPKHAVTRRAAQIVREIRNGKQSRVGSSKLVPAEYVRTLLRGLQELFPSASRVSEMLEYAKECSGKLVVTFPAEYRIENLINSDELYRVGRASPVPRILKKNEEKQARKFSKGMNKYEVFLGGSCNPTTWRTDFAIPELEKMGISYYNPQQVEEWRPELLEAEYHAKENATVMFFVLDNQTRGVSALIEVAHLVGNRRELILVIQSYTQENQMICDEEISNEEYEDLRKGQEVLRALVERQGIPVFDNIQVALGCTEKILKDNLRVQDLQAPVLANRESLISPRDVFEELCAGTSDQISASDACLALRILTQVKVSVADLKNLIGKAGKELNGTFAGDLKFDFETFTELVARFKIQVEEEVPLDSSTPLHHPCSKDVYLGGTIENTSWRESVAVPALEEKSLSYFVPKISEGGKRFSEIEAAAMDSSFLLLFVITNTARSIAAMAIAGHYIGKGANVVLCVEHLPENALVGEERLSENAVKDYNRGRMYLMDIAERSGVPVFHDVSTAVNFVIRQCICR